MKKNGVLLALFLTLSILKVSTGIANPQLTRILDNEKRNRFSFQVDRAMLGCEVIITRTGGEQVARFSVKRKKVIIDFSNLRFGCYKVTLTKNGSKMEEFTYTKELILSMNVR